MTPTQIFLESLLQALSAGLALGCVYGLMCTGLGLIFGVMRVINFAQGDFMMLGMYAAFFAFPVLVASLGVAAPFVAAVIAGPAVFALAYLTHLLIVRQVSGVRVAALDSDAHNSQLVLTLGLALILQNGGLILFGSDPVSIRTPLSSRAWELSFLVDGGFISIFFNKVRLVAALICVGVVGALYAFIEYTRFGRSLRAAADNAQAAIYMGVDVDRAHRFAFAIGCGITAIAGGLIATYHPFQPYVGFEYVIVMYAGVVLGGIGSIIGAFWGGFVIGLVQQLSAIVLPLQLQNAAIFVVFLLVIFVYPNGFFGRSAENVMAKSTHRLMLAPLAVCAALAALALVLHNPYHHLHIALVAVWAIMGLSWNALSGYTGLISFGHASFFGLGAYTVAIGMSRFGLTPWIGIPLAALIGGIAGVAIGFPTFRLRGPYFALAMLAYPLALLYVFAWLGLQEVTLPMKRDAPVAYMQFADSRVLPVLAAALLFVAMAIARLIEASWFGRSLFAIKQNEPAAEASGIDTLRCKMIAIAISGAMAGAVGGFYAVVLLVVTPTSVFGLLASAQALVVAMFGGVGIVWGPVIGSAILIPVSELLHAELASVIPGIQGVIFGVAIVVVTILAREGIYWRVVDLFQARGRAVPVDVAPATPSEAQIVHDVVPPGDVLTVSGLSKSFGGLRAVDDVAFSVRRGEVLGIIGPNGAGKTSLFNLLNGFLKPDNGSIKLFGDEIGGWRTNAIARAGVGRTFQIARPFPRMSVSDNVIVGANAANVSAAQAKALAERAIALTGLSGVAHLTPRELTTKQLRLLELARALAGKPKLLLLDEILAGLGAEEVEEAMVAIRRVAASGITIVIIEHTMQAMMRLVDRFVVLDHGAIIATGAPNDVVQDPRVLEAYLGKQWSAHA